MTSPLNKTIKLTNDEKPALRKQLLTVEDLPQGFCLNSTICGDCLEVLPKLPHNCVDLAIIDPPYNLRKQMGDITFNRLKCEDYTKYLRSVFLAVAPLLKRTATIYICSDWYASVAVQNAVQDLWMIRNRITWQREKGRGAQRNWKNTSEDIWFSTCSANYTFNASAVMSRREVIAPYKNKDGTPRGWMDGETRFRDTAPSNTWTDITVPFWSMPENTDHPTQKPEKLIAKLILASSNPGDLILDPFLGVGTTSCVAKKLGRQYIGIELQEEFAITAQKRLNAADNDSRIQGYHDGVFWERNSGRKSYLLSSASTFPMSV